MRAYRTLTPGFTNFGKTLALNGQLPLHQDTQLFATLRSKFAAFEQELVAATSAGQRSAIADLHRTDIANVLAQQALVDIKKIPEQKLNAMYVDGIAKIISIENAALGEKITGFDGAFDINWVGAGMDTLMAPHFLRDFFSIRSQVRDILK
jgi:hypothetical protein